MFRQYAVSFLFGSLYKLTNDIYNAEGIRENIPLTIAEIVNALGYTLLTYLSTNNCNIPIALSGTYIIYKKFLGSQPKTVDVSDADAGAGADLSGWRLGGLQVVAPWCAVLDGRAEL